MSASQPMPQQMPEPPTTPEGHLNAAFHQQGHGLPDSTADHPLYDDGLGYSAGGLLGGGPQPGSLEASGTPPSVVMPVG